jgi:hypothetical protein
MSADRLTAAASPHGRGKSAEMRSALPAPTGKFHHSFIGPGYSASRKGGIAQMCSICTTGA